MTDQIRTVFVVDDDDAVRESLSMLLRSIGLPVASYSSATEFLAEYQDGPGCLVLDIRMPGMSGLELQRNLNDRHAILPIIFITGHGDVPMAVEAMQAGAADFLQKPFLDQELLDRIHRALERDQANRKLLLDRDRIIERLQRLTPREREVIDLLAQGKANKVIAADLGVSQRTVEIHRARVMEKMGAASLAHLVRMVVRAEERSVATGR